MCLLESQVRFYYNVHRALIINDSDDNLPF